MKKYIILLLVIVSCHSFSQTLNDFKYAIVPSKFAFLKDKDQYRLNTLTKMLMEKYDFITFFDTDILPAEVAEYNCNKVFVEVQSNGNMLMTKMSVILKDCKNNVLFTSVEGKSREKEYQVAYNVALREAFNSFGVLNHKYLEKLVISNDEGLKNKGIVKENSENLQDNGVYIAENDLVFQNLLVAESIDIGFLLIDPKTSTIVLKLYKTSNENVFIANSNSISGIVIKKGQEIFIEYYKDKKLLSKKLNVTF